MYFVCILQSEKDGSFYTGRTANAEDRLRRPNEGRSKYISLKRPWKLVHLEEFKTRAEAVQREGKINIKKSKSYIDFLIASKKIEL